MNIRFRHSFEPAICRQLWWFIPLARDWSRHLIYAYDYDDSYGFNMILDRLPGLQRNLPPSSLIPLKNDAASFNSAVSQHLPPNPDAMGEKTQGSRIAYGP
jgi:hypothetical protein